MTVELVRSIREAEKKADELIRRARQEARQAVKMCIRDRKIALGSDHAGFTLKELILSLIHI